MTAIRTALKLIATWGLTLTMSVPSVAGGLRCEDVFGSRLSLSESYLELMTVFDRLDPGNDYAAALESRWVRLLLFGNRMQANPQRLQVTQDSDRVIWNFMSRRHKMAFTKDPLRAVIPEMGLNDWIHRQILTEGLKGFVAERAPLTPAMTYRLTYGLQKILNHPVLKLALMRLPHVKDRPLPPELLAKIMVDGLEPHRAEAEAFYGGGQKFVDAYRGFAAGYRAILMAVTVWMLIQLPAQYQELMEQEQKASDQRVDDLIGSMDRLAEQLGAANAAE